MRASYTVEPFTPMNPITIQGSGVRLRAEPFATQQTQVLSSGSTGLPLNVVGIARMGDWNWYQVVLKSGQKAFIRSDLTSHPSQGSTRTEAPPMPVAPVIAAAPTAPPTPPAYTPPSLQPARSDHAAARAADAARCCCACYNTAVGRHTGPAASHRSAGPAVALT